MGTKKRLYQAERTNFALKNLRYADTIKVMPTTLPDGSMVQMPQLVEGSPVGLGVIRAARMLRDAAEAAAKRLKYANDPKTMTRQQRRAAARRADKQPLGMSQVQWHRLEGFPDIKARRA